MKTCRRCGQELPLQAFYVRMDHGKKRPQSWCKQCFNGRNKQKRAELAARIPAGLSWSMPSVNSILGILYRQPKGSPLREMYYRNRQQWAMDHAMLEAWWRADCMSGQEVLA